MKFDYDYVVSLFSGFIGKTFWGRQHTKYPGCVNLVHGMCYCRMLISVTKRILRTFILLLLSNNPGNVFHITSVLLMKRVFYCFS